MTTDQTFVIVGAEPGRRQGRRDAARRRASTGASCSSAPSPSGPTSGRRCPRTTCAARPAREKVYVHDEGFYAEHGIELRLGRTAVDLDTSAARGRPRRRRAAALRPAAAGHGRRAAAAARSRAPTSTASSTCAASRTPTRCARGCDRGGAVVVVGAGWIGAEVAASARQRGLDVTVIDPASRPAGARARPRGRRRLPRHPRRPRRADAASDDRRRGVRGRRARSSACGPADGRAHRLRLRGRRRRRRSRAPSSPRGAGLAVDNGILVDERLRDQRRPACSPPATSPTPTTRSTASGSASSTGPTRCTRAPAAARNMLGRPARLRPAAVLLLRPVRRRHGVRRLRPQRGTASSSAATPRAASSSPSGSPATASSPA